MSGIALAPWAFQTPVNALENSYKLAKIVGCGSLDKKVCNLQQDSTMSFSFN